jgi:endonuclease/exonuclease/phosphatase family metal-dependent hydrolase
MMKKYYSVMCALLLLTACSKDVQPAGEGVLPGEVETIILTAELPGPDTRTALSEPDGGVYKVLWQTGDQVSINGILSNEVSSAGNNQKAVDFTVSGSLSAPYKVLYPGTNSANVIALPATQNYVAGSFDPTAAASFGNARKSGDNYIASLTHFCGVICLNLNGSATLDRIELNALGGEKLYGSFTLATDSDGFTGSWSGGTAGTLTYSFGSDGLALGGTDTPLYIAIPAQTYASGIEALVYQRDGAFMRLKFWGSGRTLGANDIIIFESKTFAAGRTENLFSINNLTAEDGGEPTAEPPGITVGVYNIKMQENRQGTYNTYIDMDRADVQAGLGSTIAGMGADIFGINEIGEDNMPGEDHDIKAWAIAQGLSSSDYTWKMNYPNKVSRSGLVIYSYSAEMYYANVFAYNKNTIAVEDDGYVWLCNDEDDYWSSMENAYKHDTGRHTAVYAKCRHKVSGKRFWFIVTHFDTYYGNDDGDNLNNVKSFETFARHLKRDEEDLPIIAVGDFNFGSKEQDKTTDCPNYVELTSYWSDVYDTMYDAHDAAGDLSSWYYKTYNGTQSGSQHSYYYPFITFTKNHPDRRLDYIVYKNSASHTVAPTSYRTIRRTYEAEDENTWCPSDHLALVAYMTFD